MKNRMLHDAPVKMIHILPVDNNSSNQPLKPTDFSFFKKLIERVRQAMARTTKTPLQPTEETNQERHRLLDYAANASPIGEVQNGPVHEPLALPVQRSDTLELTMSTSEWPDRASNIVVRDIVAIQDQPSPPVNVSPTDQTDAAPALQSIDARQRFETAKTAIVAQWRREKEQIASVRAAVLIKVRPVSDRVWQSLLAARVELLHKWGAATRSILRRTRHIERRVRKMATRATVLEEKKEDRKEERQSVSRELTHELEVTKATLLAQQQALENVTVQLNAVQKELARHKNMLAGLMTQVEAVDLKIVRAIQAPPSRKAKSPADTGQPRRASTKKGTLTVERSREQRV